MSSLRYSAKLLGLFAAVVLAAATSMTFDPELIDAVRRGDVDAVRSLVRQGLDVNGAQGDGLTPLHLAATNGGAEYVREKQGKNWCGYEFVFMANHFYLPFRLSPWLTVRHLATESVLDPD